MSTATTTRSLPQHYENTIDDAERIGWDAVCTPSSVKLTPPPGKGKKYKPITLTLNPPLVPPQLRVKLTDEGFVKALREWEGEQAPAKAEDEQKADQGGKDVKLLVCPECQADGVKEPYASARTQSVAAHRRRAHGVEGSSPSALQRRAAMTRAASAKTTASAPQPQKTPVKTTSAAPAKTAASTRVPAPRATEPVKAQQEIPVNVSFLPVAVAEPLGDMLAALQTELARAAELEQEIKPLREFFDKVDGIVEDGNLTLLKALAAIQDLVAEMKKK